jgi:hypothetical protein
MTSKHAISLFLALAGLVAATAAVAAHVPERDPATVPPGPGLGSAFLATHNAIADVPVASLVHAVKPNGTDVFVQHVRLGAGADTGWHTHPGPALVLLVDGSLMYEDAVDHRCRHLPYTAAWPNPGQGFVDRGFGHVHRAVAGSAGADFYVVYLLPPGTPTHVTPTASPPECAS